MKNATEILHDVGNCTCLEEPYYDDYEQLCSVIPRLLRRIETEKGTDALHALYKLCDTRNRHNR